MSSVFHPPVVLTREQTAVFCLRQLIALSVTVLLAVLHLGKNCDRCLKPAALSACVWLAAAAWLLTTGKLTPRACREGAGGALGDGQSPRTSDSYDIQVENLSPGEGCVAITRSQRVGLVNSHRMGHTHAPAPRRQRS